MRELNIKILFVIVLNSLLIINGQTKFGEETIAKAGDNIITANEFLQRYELTPQQFRENRNIKLELKKEFLYSLIAEKLLALYAVYSSFDTIDVVSKTLKNFEEIFVRDELYKKEIKEKSLFIADSLLDSYLSKYSKLVLVYFTFPDKKKAEEFYNNKLSVLNFDSIYTKLPDHSKDTLTIVRGQFDDDTEEVLFNLTDNSITNPVQYQDSWYIFKVVSGTNTVLEKSENWENEYKQLEKLAGSRAENILYNLFIKRFFNGINAKANSNLLKSLGTVVYKILEEKSGGMEQNERLYLEPYDLLVIKDHLGKDTLSMDFIKLPEEEVDLSSFIDFFRFESFWLDTLDYRKVLRILNGKSKKFIEYRLLTKEGYRQNLQNSIEVKKNVKMWKENYLSQLVRSTIMDSIQVSDNEVKQYLNRINKGDYKIKKVNLLEFYSDNLDIIEHALSILHHEDKNDSIIARYSTDPAVELTESGYLPVTSFGESATIIDKMQIGDVYGPINSKYGFKLIKLLGIEDDSTSGINNNEFDPALKNELSYKKSNESYNNFIANLANKYGFSVDLELLHKIAVTSISSLIYKYIGFGGRILATPLLTPNMEWIEYWQKIQINP